MHTNGNGREVLQAYMYVLPHVLRTSAYLGHDVFALSQNSVFDKNAQKSKLSFMIFFNTMDICMIVLSL
jgi:hypothetical protein